MASRDLVEMKCPVCGIDYYKQRFRIAYAKKHGWESVCSKACQASRRRTRIEIKCSECGIAFVKQQSQLTIGGGDFCSRNCAAKCNNRKFPKRKKIPHSAKKRGPKKKYQTNCTLCGIEVTYTGTKPKACSNCRRILLRNNALERIRKGTHQGWASREKLKPSYPEQYFIDLFSAFGIAEGVDYRRELPESGFFIDFGFFQKKVAVEIDGKQHDYPDRKERDERKDFALITAGWIVHRIRWKNPVTPANKKYMKAEVEKLFRLLGYLERLIEKYPDSQAVRQ